MGPHVVSRIALPQGLQTQGPENGPCSIFSRAEELRITVELGRRHLAYGGSDYPDQHTPANVFSGGAMASGFAGECVGVGIGR